MSTTTPGPRGDQRPSKSRLNGLRVRTCRARRESHHFPLGAAAELRCDHPGCEAQGWAMLLFLDKGELLLCHLHYQNAELLAELDDVPDGSEPSA